MKKDLIIYTHSAWEETPPVGHDADATRRNIAPGDSLEFKGLKITLQDMIQDKTGEQDPEKAVDTARFTLTKGDKIEEMTLDERTAFNWEGFHIAILAVQMGPKELGRGLSVFEVGTLESLPPEIASAKIAGDATYRLRIPHEIQKLTLHHSATPLNPGDDFVKKLRGLQSWGASARNWWDIPYHFLIDLDGNIYQGRDYHYMGETNTKYNPWGHFLINCYGNYEVAEPNEKQLAAIVALMAWGADEFHVPSTEIYGHKDMAETACPGENLYRYIQDGELQTWVAERVKAGAPKPIWKDKLPEELQEHKD